MTVLFVLTVLMTPTPSEVFFGGDAGFKNHLASLEAHPEIDGPKALRIAQGYGSRGMVESAISWLSLAGDMGVEPSRVALVEGDAYFAAQDYAKAMAAYLHVAEQNPRHGYAHTRLWSSVRKTAEKESHEQTAHARAFLVRRGYFLSSTVAVAQPEKAAKKKRLGRLHLNLGDFSKAIDLFKSALSVHGADPESYRLLGETYLALDDVDKTMASYRLFLLCSPKETRFTRQARQLIRDIERRRGLAAGQ